MFQVSGPAHPDGVTVSLGAFTAPLVVGPLQATAVVLVNPMIPRPGVTPGAWWGNTGAVEARSAHASQLEYPAEFDPRIYMFHDVPQPSRPARRGPEVSREGHAAHVAARPSRCRPPFNPLPCHGAVTTINSVNTCPSYDIPKRIWHFAMPSRQGMELASGKAPG